MADYSLYDWRVACVQGAVACLSGATTVTLIACIAYPFLRDVCRRPGVGHNEESSLSRRQMILFVLFMLFGDLFQSFSGFVQIHWAMRRGIDADSAVCRAQGVVLMAGDLATGYFNVVIAIQTFITIVARKEINHLVAGIIIIGGWLFIMVMTLLGPLVIQDTRGSFWGIAGIWCFIPDYYAAPRVWLHYFPIYLYAAIIVLAYGSLFWSLRGHLYRSRAKRSPLSASSLLAARHAGRVTEVNSVSYKLLWYPIAYLCIVLPISIARIVVLRGGTVPNWFSNLGVTLLYLNGFVNGVIYMSTRSTLTPLYLSCQWRPKSFKRPSDARPPVTPVYEVWVTREQELHEQSPSSIYSPAFELAETNDRGVKIPTSEFV